MEAGVDEKASEESDFAKWAICAADGGPVDEKASEESGIAK